MIFFFITLCTNAFLVTYFILQLCFRLPKEDNHHTHALEVFSHTVYKVVKDVVSYAHIQANNAYYKGVLGLEMNKKLGSSAIYLTEEQYGQVKICKSFYIQY
jgi:hypothetical protein